MNIGAILFLLFSLFLGSFQTPVSEPVHVIDTESMEGVFGFTNADGTSIIVHGLGVGQEAAMSKWNKAIGESGKVLSVKYATYQKGNIDKSSGRDTSYNFENMAGYIFNVKEGSSTPNETYFLINENDFDLKALLPIKKTEDALKNDSLIAKEISAKKQRPITNIWQIAQFSDSQKLFLVKFKRQGDDMLFSLVLQREDKLLFNDFPAKTKDEISVWRVDDGGEVTPDMFSLLFAAKTSDGLALSIEWWGSEGENTFVIADDGEQFHELPISYYRYTYPT
ncbi:hypothetical protein ACFPVX_03655 [Cohnella faecalis]|uniref:Uncharacterized protein n=1 Tax=Cohnella faecalis TaxID=2315694 RepID=A0A398CJ99_9BACL|nr:hypothetical protein [Cohnella faecalis]RIE03386.1 hypothetical protein D3H35_11965 [Cohnella faecalis]